MSKTKLYDKLVPSSLPEKEGEFQRKNTYAESHRDMMAARYYYHTTICRSRYDDTLVQLSKEFGLATSTILGHLNKRVATVNEMIEGRVSTAQLRKKYPWYVWDGRPLGR